MVILMILQELGVPIGPIIAGAGIIGIAVGFGGQYLIKDIISGFFIILENQYRIGDVIKIADVSGAVEDISLRMTTLRDLDGTVHHVPHGEVTKVSNMTKYFSRININIGVSYNAKLEHVIDVVNQVGNDLAGDPEWKDVITSPPQFLRVDEFADSSVVVKILGETKSSEQWRAAGELRKRLKIAFDREGIEIPFPQVVVNQPASKA
jgi:small conductance mechanosensitive channel